MIAVTFYKWAASLRNQAFADIGQPKRRCTSLLKWLDHLFLKISTMGGSALSVTPFVCTKLASCGGRPYALHSALWNMRGIGTCYWSGLESGILKPLRRPVHRVQTREMAQWPCSVVFFGLWSQEFHLAQYRTPQDVVCFVFFSWSGDIWGSQWTTAPTEWYKEPLLALASPPIVSLHTSLSSFFGISLSIYPKLRSSYARRPL